MIECSSTYENALETIYDSFNEIHKYEGEVVKKIITMVIVLFVAAAAFCQITEAQPDVERLWGYEEITDLAPGIGNMKAVILYVFGGTATEPPKLQNANGCLSVGITCVAQTGGLPGTFADSVYIRLTSADSYVPNDTLWGKPMMLTSNDTIRVGHPTRDSWNQKINVGDLQQDILVAPNSDHEGYMPAMFYLIEIWRIDISDAASRFKFRIGFVVEDC